MKFVLYTAEWSHQGKAVKRLLEEILTSFDVVTNPQIHSDNAIRIIPTLVKLEDGEEVARTNATDLGDLILFVKGE